MEILHNLGRSGATVSFDRTKSICTGTMMFTQEYVSQLPSQGMIDDSLHFLGFSKYVDFDLEWDDCGSSPERFHEVDTKWSKKLEHD